MYLQRVVADLRGGAKATPGFRCSVANLRGSSVMPLVPSARIAITFGVLYPVATKSRPWPAPVAGAGDSAESADQVRRNWQAIFDAEPGSLFIMRNVANLVPPYEPEGKYHGTSAAVEYAVTALRVPHLGSPCFCWPTIFECELCALRRFCVRA